jgi:3',5'-nucleoside bisphosphate phosphatase
LDLLREATADLHVHTHCSDGLCSPTEVVELAAQAGLSWISVTDHDTTIGLEEAGAAAERVGIGFVPGVELSVEFHGQDFHILGYWVDPEDPALVELLSEVVAARKERARRIINRLHALGVNLPFEQIETHRWCPGYVGRPQVAHALMAGGWVSTFPEAFARFLGKDAPAYVGKAPIEPSRAIGTLLRAGGVPVLAHPGAYRLNGALDVFVKEGLQGIEVEHPKHTPDMAAGFRRLAERLGLAMTGGSDFHGRGMSEILIGGTRIDAGLLEPLAARKGR